MAIKSFLKNIVKKREKTLLVLLYHKVFECPNPDGLTVLPEVYEEHMVFLKSNFKIFANVNEWEKSQDSGVLITFDDGYINNLNNVLATHEKLEIPFTLFTTTHWLNGDFFWWDIIAENKAVLEKKSNKSVEDWLKEIMHLPSILEKEKVVKNLIDKFNLNVNLDSELRCMNKNQLLKFSSNPLVSIGSHTLTHPRLALLNADEQKQEITNSKMVLQDLTQASVKIFSYPHGGKTAFNSLSKTCVKKAGYNFAFAAYSGRVKSGFDPYEIPRIHIGNISTKELKQKINYFL